MRKSLWTPFIASVLIATSAGGYYLLSDYKALETQQAVIAAAPFEQLSLSQMSDKRILTLQDKLYDDKQNAKLWYQLGNAYMYNGEYDDAVLVFDYAIRLTEKPTAMHYSAKASALYYANAQHLTADVQALLDQALALEPNNQTALMMLASNEFMNVRYQQAIDLWVQLLDSDQQGLDRVSIINSINQAKQFIQ
ncbi:tetratricopeptide repeat protein [Moritella sp. F3]|uniref:TPR domain-containing protein n=1 Tax=Moritella sp. F3 TaxID=2718882 RepID=UPI0018E1272A|nr:tetratricopeptide repeat protein [Moritella sp. F3]GIC78708.1 heme lyase (NrfEFG) for insertion of heme into c552, subunit NrfG [Moritella sp. F1]GIC81364.1 heme lyase (NrfEFG) for insertion of heme into c552, subunit NrfG [Moritella sp. F3]